MSDAILVRNPILLNAIIGSFGFDPLSGEDSGGFKVFKKDSLTLFFREGAIEALPVVEERSRLFFLDFGRGIGSEVQTGDVVLPNFFFPYNTEAEAIDPSNHENFEHIGEGAMFIENYEEQGDYDFEKFAMSVGGGVISLGEKEVPSKEYWTILSAAYGADVVDAYSHTLAKLAEGKIQFFSILPIIESVSSEETFSETQAAEHGVIITKFLAESISEEPLVSISEEDIFDIDSNHDEQD